MMHLVHVREDCPDLTDTDRIATDDDAATCPTCVAVDEADPLAATWEAVQQLTASLRAIRPTDVTLSEYVDLEIDSYRDDHPATGYGVRVTFADGTGYDIDNVDAVQIHDKADKTFPFGFIETEEGHKPVYWAAEDGRMHQFPPAAAPTPNGGW